MLKVGSDFSGVGAFDQALKRLGVNYKTVFSCDMDKYARESYIENYGEPEYYPQNVYERDIPQESLDIYMTSPPCQSFSMAGKRKGKDSANGILFFNSHEFIQQNKPRFFIFENVKGLLSDDNGKTFQEWTNMLGGKSINGLPVIFPFEKSVPYHIYWKVLNSKKHGVPQNRERVFIVGVRDDKDNNFQFPKEEHLYKKLKDVLEEDVNEKYYLSKKLCNWIIKHREKRESKNNFPMDNNGVSGCITSRIHKCGAEDPYIKIESKYKKEIIQSIKQDVCTCIDASYYKGFGVRQGKCRQVVKATSGIRRLTPRECFRLQDFPEDFKFVVSNTQLYKQAGNSITVGVLAKIISKLNL
jgi:DNA (cytosine-5)-methyltransferase 1